MSLAREIFLAFRPKTLTAALVPCVAASALSASDGYGFGVWIFGFALLAAVFIQIGTNLVNDAVDFVKGADTGERIGPRRITASGVLTEKQTMKIAAICFGLAILAGIPLVLQGGWPIVLIGLVSIVCAYAYTAGPFPLAYVGLGDVFVILFFGLIAVGGLFYIQTESLSVDAIWLGLQVGLHAAVLIAINNLRDREGDAKAGKKTLAVRLGIRSSRFEIGALVLAPFYMNIWWLWQGELLACLLPLVTAPLAYSLMKGIFSSEPGPVYNRYLGMAAGLHAGFGLLLSAGMVWG